MACRGDKGDSERGFARGPRVERYEFVRASLHIVSRAREKERMREARAGGTRFCFLVTFIWALGDVVARALHKSGVAVCECRHHDINPGARRLPSGYLPSSPSLLVPPPSLRRCGILP